MIPYMDLFENHISALTEGTRRALPIQFGKGLEPQVLGNVHPKKGNGWHD